MNIIYKDGNCVEPEETGKLVICHCVNDHVGGAMGAGVAAALMKKWPKVREKYMDWAGGVANIKAPYRLGEVQFVQVEDEIWVCNLIGQRGTSDFHGMPPVRYESVKEGFYKVLDAVKNNQSKFVVSKFKLILPRICCSLAGGSWAVIEEILEEVFGNVDIDIVVYTYGPYNE